MEITVLKKTTIGRTWGWDGDEGGHRLTLALLVSDHTCFRSLFFLLPFLRHHKSTGNSSWTKQHFYWVASPSTVSYSNLFWISILYRKLDFFFFFSAIMSFSYFSFSEKEWSFGGICNNWINQLKANGRYSCSDMKQTWASSLISSVTWVETKCEQPQILIHSGYTDPKQRGRCLYTVPPTE